MTSGRVQENATLPTFRFSHSFVLRHSHHLLLQIWRESDAILLPQARACELEVSIPAPPDRSSEENAWFRALPFGRCRIFQEFLFGNCIVRFDVVSADTGTSPDELSDQSIGNRGLWNCLCELNNCFTKSGRSFFQIVNLPYLWSFADNSRIVIPKRIGRVWIRGFRF